MSVGFQRNTWPDISEDRIPHNHRGQNLKFYIKSTGLKMTTEYKETYKAIV
jgi:hypothetical protein